MEQNTAESYKSYNDEFVTDSAIDMRLNTQPIINKIELFLKGKSQVLQNTPEGVKLIEVKIGQPKLNELGIQSILAEFTTIINQATVQGNYDKDMYFQQISSMREEFAFMIVLNKETWAVSEGDMDFIVDLIMNFAKPFLSRLIDNKERESYANTIRANQNSNRNMSDEKQGFFKRN